MFDIATGISTSIETTKAAISIVNSLRSVDKKIEQAELNNKLADLVNLLADLKLSLADVKEDNHELKRQLWEANQQQSYRSQLRFENNVLVPIKDELEGYGEGPWCSRCFDVEQQLIALHHKLASYGVFNTHSSEAYKWECPSCKSSMSAPNKTKDS